MQSSTPLSQQTFFPILMTKNIHLEHPEDSILDGTLSILGAFLNVIRLSVKFDGAPAIVWGTNPATGNFFVGTKSVFNKKKIRICETPEQITEWYGGTDLEIILGSCLCNLPHTDRIYQGDFIGFGGDTEYTPNTITYKFDSPVAEEIIMAPHTEYVAESDLRDAVAYPICKYNPFSASAATNPDGSYFVKWVGADAVGDFEPLRDKIQFARQMAQLVEFEDAKGATQLKKDLNAFIRDGEEIVPELFANYQLVRLWKLVASIKEDAMRLIEIDSEVGAFIGDDEIDCEGYVMHSEHGSWKLVDRAEFSHANFNMGVGA